MMEIPVLVTVEAGIVVMLEGCPYNRSECTRECGIGGTYSFPQRPSPNFPLSYGSIEYLGENINEFYDLFSF